MVPVRFAIPEEVLASLNLPAGQAERELCRALGVALSAKGRLSVGTAAELAEMTRWAFEELVGGTSGALALWA